MLSVYELLVEQLEDELGPIEINSWKGIVDYLSNEGFLDYDVLKEILLAGRE